MSFTAAQYDAVRAATATTIPTSSADVAGVSECTVSITNGMAELSHIGADGIVRNIPTMQSYSISLSGQVNLEDTPQNLIRTAFLDRTLLQLSVITDASAGVGEVLGTRYPVYVESYEETRGSGDAVNFSASFALADAPVEMEVAA